ncbi:mitochondrial uncoupling protein 3-like isoform X2 [Nasonia vitripennis]|uniref:Mitochondrial 2-oxoglutarate/malate carrier protein n=1 Tax=Nasonia vitripennis TaxID=7425 RepID=A0A7M7HD85_NASVI|nr:mitochondrial uncoupling protein 3-like isoform X2 [Nasonia vitripennis]
MSGNKDSGSGPPKKVKPLPPLVNFLNAGLSGMCATCFVHPMDVLKNRMQMSKEGVTITQTISTIFRNEGIFKFYAGLSAGLVRQATYTTARLGIYNQLQDIYRERYSEEKPTFARLALMAATAGSMGAFVGTPAEVALVRMTSDGRLPPGYDVRRCDERRTKEKLQERRGRVRANRQGGGSVDPVARKCRHDGQGRHSQRLPTGHLQPGQDYHRFRVGRTGRRPAALLRVDAVGRDNGLQLDAVRHHENADPEPQEHRRQAAGDVRRDVRHRQDRGLQGSVEGILADLLQDRTPHGHHFYV